MSPQEVFCLNPDCPAKGQRGKGNISVHSYYDELYICHVCHKTFSATKDTIFRRLRTAPEIVVQVITLLAHGGPLQAAASETSHVQTLERSVSGPTAVFQAV